MTSMEENIEKIDEEIDEDEYSTEIEDMMLNIAWKDYDYCFDDKKVVENKVSILLAANGIFIGLITTVAANLNPQLLPLGYLFLFGSVLLGILALNFRNYNFIRAKPIWEEMKKVGDEEIPYRAKRSLFKTIDSVNEKNREKYNDIVKYTQYSLYSFTIGIMIIIMAILVPKICIC